ncbi:MAG TPA: hypothetical protein VIZ90_09250 [Rhizobiaceae bacterium]
MSIDNAGIGRTVAAANDAGQRKTGARLLLTPVIQDLGSSHSASLEAEVGSIRR